MSVGSTVTSPNELTSHWCYLSQEENDLPLIAFPQQRAPLSGTHLRTCPGCEGTTPVRDQPRKFNKDAFSLVVV